MQKLLTLLCLIALSAYSNISLMAKGLNSDSEYHLLVLSDIHLGAKRPMDTTPNGPHLYNDLDLTTFNNLLDKINQTVLLNALKPQITLVLGDLVDHNDSSKYGTVAKRSKQLKNSFSFLLQKTRQTNIPLSYVFGNNDSLLGNYKPFYSEKLSPHSPYEIAKNAGWEGGFLSIKASCQSASSSYPCLISDGELQRDGYYAEYLQPHLKLLAINSALFSRKLSCKEACKGQLDWLEDQLLSAAQNQDQILIAMHIPPGLDLSQQITFWHESLQRSFLQLLKPHAHNILAIMAAHTHMEELALIKLQDQLIPVIYSAGLSTSHGNLPAFKYLSFSKDLSGKWLLKNYETFRYFQEQFTRLYDFQALYCPTDALESVAGCLQLYIEQNKMDDLLTHIFQFYTLGNPNYQLVKPTWDPHNLIISLPAENN